MNSFEIDQGVPELWTKQVPASTGLVPENDFTRTKVHRATPQITRNAKSSTMEVKSSVQDHIGHIRTCPDMFRIPPGKWTVF